MIFLRGWSKYLLIGALWGGIEVYGAGPSLSIIGGPAIDEPALVGFESFDLPFQPGQPLSESGLVVGSLRYDALPQDYFRAVHWGAPNSATVEFANGGLNSQGDPDARAFAINDMGTAVGYSRTFVNGIDAGIRPTRWEGGAIAPTELPSLSTTPAGIPGGGAVYAINNSGTAVGIVGKFFNGTSGTRAARWNDTGSQVLELAHISGSPNGGSYTEAYDINESGISVGFSDKYSSGSWRGQRAVRWEVRNVATELGNLGTDASGFALSQATAINDQGVAIGYAPKVVGGSSKGTRAVRWDANTTTATELKPLSTDPQGVGASAVRAINNLGAIVGVGTVYEGNDRLGLQAVMWLPGTSDPIALEDYGIGLAGRGGTTRTVSSAAQDVNDLGFVVGTAVKFDELDQFIGQRAILWGPDRKLMNLNDFVDPSSGWLVLSSADSISNSGWVAGFGVFDPDGAGGVAPYRRSYLININGILAVPEPATVFLAGCVFAAFFAVSYRQRQVN
jgi:hypothetical protein